MPEKTMPSLVVRELHDEAYQTSLSRMRTFTAQRSVQTPDEIWLIEHEPVFTQGLAGKAEHVHDTRGIPVIQTERGGQITYHGPGQVMAYLLLDIRRRGITVTRLVRTMEQAIMDCLAQFNIKSAPRPGAPGVYVTSASKDNGAKIASVGLKVTRGCTFHGLALNVDMDLEPFSYIDPCGMSDLSMIDMRSLNDSVNKAQVADALARHLTLQIEQASQPIDQRN